MSNLRQNMTEDEWNSSSLPKVNYTRSEIKKIIREFAKDLSNLDDDFVTDTWINDWIERKLEL
jgi:hypothetical protein